MCEVDYVEVFNASTHAWVRVRGYEDYRRAFRELMSRAGAAPITTSSSQERKNS